MPRKHPHPKLERLEQQSAAHQPPVRQLGLLQVLQRLMIRLQVSLKLLDNPHHGKTLLCFTGQSGIFPAFSTCSTTQAAAVVGSLRGRSSQQARAPHTVSARWRGSPSLSLRQECGCHTHPPLPERRKDPANTSPASCVLDTAGAGHNFPVRNFSQPSCQTPQRNKKPIWTNYPLPSHTFPPPCFSSQSRTRSSFRLPPELFLICPRPTDHRQRAHHSPPEQKFKR